MGQSSIKENPPTYKKSYGFWMQLIMLSVCFEKFDMLKNYCTNNPIEVILMQLCIVFSNGVCAWIHDDIKDIKLWKKETIRKNKKLIKIIYGPSF